MASITAGPEFHDAPPPGFSSASIIEQDAPALLGLHHEAPQLHIYTASNADYEALNRVNDRSVTILPVATNGLTLAIRNSGVDQGGRNLAFGPKDVSLDVRSMDKIVLSADRREATIEGGVIGGKLLKFLDDHGLTTPTAFSSAVGYVGWACGGGYSSLNGIMGLGVDNILGGRVVLADGRIMDTDEAGCDPDLLWALRGGGAGLVGVVTSLRVRVHRRPDCLAGNIIFPLTEAPQIARQLNELYAWKKPSKFAGDVAVIDPTGDGAIFAFLFFWALDEDRSDLEEAKDYLERVLKFGTVIANTAEETTPHKFLVSITQPPLYGDLIHFRLTASVPNWSEELGRIISEPMPTPSALIIMHDSHGAGTRASGSTAVDSAVFSNREPHLMFGFFAAAPSNDQEGLEKSKAWAYRLVEKVTKAGLAMPTRYINFTHPLKGDGFGYYGAQGLIRIKAVKGRLDPLNLFSKNTPDLAETLSA
ncbi:FAD binding domain-containing protein [Trichoderma breve]|uniref:FAD binding domain-containing protein n=1 Tax=Trichoderma breve TaxID=2034170 RepID=A0A9W9BJ49_9HYPO|nr:FAD binding domain-containing protein [Trichoderma breve]KAJ4860701.1 FAD binding domain-containing protein [Trichoderma breve]